jgi:DNA-binding NarL/FixJ family response regulator
MKKPRVLLADAHKVMLEGLRYLLEPAFEIVGMVDNSESLLESADNLMPDIVVMDLSITIETARKLKKQNPQQRIVFLSTYNEPAVMKQALGAGSLGFVLLQSAAWDLIPAIGAVLEGQTYVSPSVHLTGEEQ